MLSYCRLLPYPDLLLTQVRSVAPGMEDGDVAEVAGSCGGIPLLLRLVSDALATGRTLIEVETGLIVVNTESITGG